jgi:hypothetical protein
MSYFPGACYFDFIEEEKRMLDELNANITDLKNRIQQLRNYL